MPVPVSAIHSANPLYAQKRRLIKPIEDFSTLLRAWDLDFDPSDLYWQVGDIQEIQGWILHLSVVVPEIPALVRTIMPLLISKNIPFKIVRDTHTAQLMLDGNLGFKNVGKIICLYPGTESQALELSRKLIEITKLFKGPAIPTDRHLGSILYTRYGSFKELVPDPYSTSFSLPEGVAWPFRELAEPVIPKDPKLLHQRYYPYSILKNDAKGKVIKALYFKHPWQISFCVVKQGRRNCFCDESGRDIRDRLHWQYELHQKLSGSIPIPKLIDLFDENGNTYLSMEFIDGISMDKYISNVYGDRNWLELSLPSQLTLLDSLLEIFGIIETLHEEHYLHRDISPANFLITRKKKLFLIDLELAWSLDNQKPSPPFELGTPGFISPEQYGREMPSVKQDIYAIGALIVVFFTNLNPTKLPIHDPVSVERALQFFADNPTIAKLTSDCLSPDPESRPELPKLKATLMEYRQRLKDIAGPTEPLNHHTIVDRGRIEHLVQAAIRGLADPVLQGPEQRWHSLKKDRDDQIGNENLEFDVYPGWHTGVSGTLWLLARARQMGFDIDPCRELIESNWNFIKESILTATVDVKAGLFHGAAGATLALTESIIGNLIPFDKDVLAQNVNGFLPQPASLTLSEGLSGLGIALLRSEPLLGTSHCSKLLDPIVNIVLDTQQPNGSWSLSPETVGKGSKQLGLSTGIAGIIWFLLAYETRHPENVRVKASAFRALQWLTKSTGIKQSNHWQLRSNKISLSLLFVKAYEVTRNDHYQEIVEANLISLSSRAVYADFTLGSGLAGIGELYLEASKIFADAEWQERADWIAQLYFHCFIRRDPNDGYWLPNGPLVYTADLFTGNAGIIHFLMRYLFPEKLSHPLWPFQYCVPIRGNRKPVKRVGISFNH